jgi:hypothetical protein
MIHRGDPPRRDGFSSMEDADEYRRRSRTAELGLLSSVRGIVDVADCLQSFHHFKCSSTREQ